MKQRSIEFDFVFITNIPSFYKINLYNEICKKHRIFVIFIAEGSSIRTKDFTHQPKMFDFAIVNTSSVEKRPLLKSLIRIKRILNDIHYRILILGGWDLLEYWLLAFLSSKDKNYAVIESTRFESAKSGLKKQLKKIFLKRIHGAFCPGESTIDLLNALEYRGLKIKNYGVGLIHRSNRTVDRFYLRRGFKDHKFLYVGRLSPEKNVSILIRVFKYLPHHTLTIAGDGPLRDLLVSNKPDNIRCLGHIDFSEMHRIYKEHTILILPSFSETWGLAIEEALYYGLPVIASNKVGSRIDMIEHYRSGQCFDPLSEKDLLKAIHNVVEHYDAFVENVRNIDFDQRALHAVQCYDLALEKA